jgi:hypothetical protein
MSAPRLTPAQRGAVAVVVLLAGLVCWSLSRIISVTEHHAYSVNASAPSTVRVTAGQTYQLSVPGGLDELTKKHEPTSLPQCQWSMDGTALQDLPVTVVGDDKATNVVGSFTAPQSGRISVECAAWGSVFVDDADGAQKDPAGFLLVLSIVAFTVGVGLGLSALWDRRERRERRERGDSALGPRHGDQVEAVVHVGDIIAHYREVGGPDGRDVDR